MKFSTQVSMKVTEKQFRNDLIQPLGELGYSFGYTYGRFHSSRPYIVNEYDCINGAVGREYEPLGYYIDHYNPKLFLALAAMTEGEDFIVGEYIKCIKSTDGYYTAEIIRVEEYRSGASGLEGSFGPDYSRLYYCKPTVEDLVAAFGFPAENTQPSIQITRNQLKELYDKTTCEQYKQEIRDFASKELFFTETYNIPRTLYNKAYKHANKEQKKLLDSWNIPSKYGELFVDGKTFNGRVAVYKGDTTKFGSYKMVLGVGIDSFFIKDCSYPITEETLNIIEQIRKDYLR